MEGFGTGGPAVGTMPVAERFVSVNGEGPRAGSFSAFVRFRGCNLACSYCDTQWACQPGCPVEELDPGELASWERNFLLGKTHGNCSAVAYINYCYIMSDTGVCVTVYELPRWFGRKKHFDGKARIRDYRKYMKNYADAYEDCDTMPEYLN